MKSLFTIFLISILGFNFSLSQNKDNDSPQRTVLRKFDLQKNSVSNVEFFITNFGINSNDIEKANAGGGFWPRNSGNQYLFGGGLWFAGVKNLNGINRKLVETAYNPNNGKSWFVPGHIVDGDTALNELYKYRAYFSTDFDKSTGKNFDDISTWPYWKLNNEQTNPLKASKAEYSFDITKRNNANYPFGTSILSDEDIHSMYKDTDLKEFDGGMEFRKNLGYPLKLQVEEHIYTWKNEDFKDAFIRVYEIQNYSSDTIKDCIFAQVMDIDIIATKNGKPIGKMSENIKYFSEDTCMRMGVAWADDDSTRNGKGFGYFAFNFIETPKIDKNGYLVNDKPFYPINEQLPISRFGIWNIENDIPEDSIRYAYMNKNQIDIQSNNTTIKDTRSLISSGTFKLLPNQKVRFALGYAFALPAKSKEPIGTYEDITGLPFETNSACGNHPSKKGSTYDKLKRLTDLYYNNIVMDIAENTPSNQFNISPNPAVDFITLQNVIPAKAGIYVEIFNIFGEKVEQTFLSVQIGQTGMSDPLKIDVSNLAQGVYFIKIGDKFEKFVKY